MLITAVVNPKTLDDERFQLNRIIQFEVEKIFEEQLTNLKKKPKLKIVIAEDTEILEQDVQLRFFVYEEIKEEPTVILNIRESLNNYIFNYVDVKFHKVKPIFGINYW